MCSEEKEDAEDREQKSYTSHLNATDEFTLQSGFKDLGQDKAIRLKDSIKEPPELELKQLPNYLEYAFLVENSKLPVIIASDLSKEQKE